MRPQPQSQLAIPDAGLSRLSGVREFLAELKKSTSVSGYHFIPATAPNFVEPPTSLDEAVVAALRGRGIEKLYSHQRHAFELASTGNNVVVITPTASGKTLCYNL